MYDKVSTFSHAVTASSTNRFKQKVSDLVGFRTVVSCKSLSIIATMYLCGFNFVPTMAAASGTLRELVSDFVKLDQFNGGNFLRWQKKMHFLLSTLKVVYVLTIQRPEEGENDSVAITRKREKWDNVDYMSKGHILNGLVDGLFDTYQNEATTR
ncbi:Polyprotein, related, putative [Theobroma cacao]|uniref:Polyprotein, related, putative n=1 Tax=Theobroma cacao TaxID=3641 RepID=A0A061GPQ6_THECC|nr:Polyprotein, related, putative [Theobroma cacao]